LQSPSWHQEEINDPYLLSFGEHINSQLSTVRSGCQYISLIMYCKAIAKQSLFLNRTKVRNKKLENLLKNIKKIKIFSFV